MPDMSLPAIGALVRYIRRFTAAMGGDIPVEGRMGRYGFCAAGDSQQVRVYWVQVGRQRNYLQLTLPYYLLSGIPLQTET